jgi:hypothetical protein
VEEWATDLPFSRPKYLSMINCNVNLLTRAGAKDVSSFYAIRIGIRERDRRVCPSVPDLLQELENRSGGFAAGLGMREEVYAVWPSNSLDAGLRSNECLDYIQMP